MSVLHFFLCTGTIPTCFGSIRNSPLSMQVLKFLETNGAIMSLFSLIILIEISLGIGISLFWQAFLICESSMILLTSLELVFLKLSFDLHDQLFFCFFLFLFCFFNTWGLSVELTVGRIGSLLCKFLLKSRAIFFIA